MLDEKLDSSKKHAIMKNRNRLIVLAMLPVVVWLVYACTTESGPDLLAPEIVAEMNVSDPQIEELNVLISKYLGYDPDQSVVLFEEAEPWINESITLEDSTANAFLPLLLEGKSVSFYTYDIENDGWKQFLIVAGNEFYLAELEGDLLELEAMVYQLCEDGTKKPETPKYPKPEKKKYGDRKGCEVFECSDGYCSSMIYIPCRGHRSNCATDADCNNDDDEKDDKEVGSDDVRFAIESY